MTRLTTTLNLRYYASTTLGRIGALASCCLFLASGLAFLPYLGLQNDEALFADALFEPKSVAYLVKIGHSRFPLMLMTYLGTVKSWTYRPIFHLFGTGIWTIRIPMLLAGTASVWLFYLFLRKIAGQRAALVGCALLAVDSLYLLTICFDWGPVALQHLLLVSGALLLVRFYQTGSEQSLGWGWGLRMSSPRRVLQAIDRLNRAGIPAVLAVHPWELDPDPPRVRLPAGLRFAHYFRLAGFADRLQAIVSGGRFGPISAIAPAASAMT